MAPAQPPSSPRHQDSKAVEPGCERPGPTIHVRGLLLLKIIDGLEIGTQRFLQNPATASNLLPFRLRHREEGQRGKAAPFWHHWVSCFPWRPPTYASPPGRIICPARHLSSPPESQLAGGGEIGAAHRGMPPPLPALTCVPPPASLSRTGSPKPLPLGGCANLQPHLFLIWNIASWYVRCGQSAFSFLIPWTERSLS